jgi:repressor LexA
MKFLTPKQKQVLDYIQGYQKEHGYAPSQQEIAKHFGFSSLGTIQHYLNQLRSLGLLEKSWNARRGLSVPVKKVEGELRSPTHVMTAVPPSPVPGEGEGVAPQCFLPLLGKVAAGLPIEAVANMGHVEVPASLLGRSGEHFVLQVQGDSMIGDGILDGDFVVIRQQSMAENGETVVALVDNEATIKRYYRTRDKIELRAANPSYPSIQVDLSKDFAPRFRIEGVLAGLIRKT